MSGHVKAEFCVGRPIGGGVAKGAARGKWLLQRGKSYFWDSNKVATGHVRGMATDEG